MCLVVLLEILTINRMWTKERNVRSFLVEYHELAVLIYDSVMCFCVHEGTSLAKY